MIVDPSTPGKHPQPSSSTALEEYDQLRLNPGAPARKPRSAGKFCLYLILSCVFIVGGITFFFFVKNFIYAIQHPHKDMYFDKPEAEVKDWSAVVQPMVREKDEFDVVASVWVWDDSERGRDDEGVWVDGEYRGERLIYEDVVFRGQTREHLELRFESIFRPRTASTLVGLESTEDPELESRQHPFIYPQFDQPSTLIPLHLSSTTLIPDLPHPSGRQPTLEDQIFNSFGFTIPLIQFHNITKNATDSITSSEAPTAETDADGDDEWDEEKAWMEEAEKEDKKHQSFSDDFMDIFRLDFNGGAKPASSKHPFIAARTHLNIVDETRLFKRQAYMFTQKELMNNTCQAAANPAWYQCKRWYYQSGVFETRVVLNPPPDAKKNRFEHLYAPYLNAVKRSAGPKDLIPIPSSSEAEAFVDVNWKLSFKASKPGYHMLHAMLSDKNLDLNLTASDNELAHAQHVHDLTLGLLGYRVDDGAHPRRAHILYFASLSPTNSIFVRVICWALTIHYWYTRNSTVGISRIGTALVALYLLMSANEEMISSVLNPERKKSHWLSKIPISYIFLVIPPLVMLKAVARLEFGSPKGMMKKSGWMPKAYLAQATHWERASERIETRVSKRAKVLFLISLFALAHFFVGPYSYFITPRIPPPPPKAHPLHTLSDHVPTIFQHVHSLGLTLELGGTVFQFLMNHYSRTYAGKYKGTAGLMFLAEVLLLLDLLPSVVGTSSRIGGVFVKEVLGLSVAALDLFQAVRYRSVKTSDTDGTEE
ncbi:hypothetical protein NP233_g1806 [Leucocoprinus birnbaumii]|uniref:Uncharacterized protein n=1 Tax=Leucocoprinus birnbaumii TaxID=56174 RepID=A0AAD5YXQ0_9AGAR|nr:hypothetical protein NP233_g1806 [Leucocoprinus birnbaumii]